MLRPCTPSLTAGLLCLLIIICSEPFLPRCAACTLDDRTALLDIRNYFFHQDADFYQPDWSSRDCCRWDGVTCNSRTGRVTGLDLGNFEPYSPSLLNATLFLPLQELRNLSLRDDLVKGCIPGAGFEVWSKLQKLESLDLSGNVLNDTSISSLVALSSIRSLLLNDMVLSAARTIQRLSTMKLETLDLCGNGIYGSLSTDVCNMASLQELHLCNNFLSGELPRCMQNLTSLKILDLSNNHLTVKFPSVIFSSLTSLVKLSLSNNDLQGLLFPSSLLNNSQLTHLRLASSGNNFQMGMENQATVLSARLQVLVLRNCNLNGNSAVIRSLLLHQHALYFVDISNNNQTGSFPSWLIENNVDLSYLLLRGNSFSGPLLLPSKAHINLAVLDASCNSLHKLPMEINITFPNLHFLNLSANSFQGVFPSALSYMALESLDLSYNNFSDNIGATLVRSMPFLILSHNQFYGSLPRELSASSFSNLLLNNNRISGEIPKNICYIRGLIWIDFSNNDLTGSVPTCIYTLPDLAILNLRENSLVGSIPPEICKPKNLTFLDVSKNNLSGPIHCMPDAGYIHLSENQFNGTFPFPLSLNTSIQSMDLRGNQFSGTLPSRMFKAFPVLKVLLLERNKFEGMIPNDICHLKYLRLLDLSHNKLSGQLPSCLSNMGLDVDLFVFDYQNANYSGEQFEFDRGSYVEIPYIFEEEPDQEEFMTKSRQDNYKGKILNYMSGLDFSSNQLIGSIPQSIGDMKWLRALNFSDNYLDGSIPKSFSNLRYLESLDLSYNKLTGKIPPELVALFSLEVFSVAYNNLSGPTPGTKGQFSTFDPSSYEGNPYLCGPPLSKSCTMVPSIPQTEEHGEEDDDKIGDIILFGCSALFYVVGFWTSLGMIYFKASWRWSWFSAVDRFADFVTVKLAIITRKIRRTN